MLSSRTNSSVSSNGSRHHSSEDDSPLLPTFIEEPKPALRSSSRPWSSRRRRRYIYLIGTLLFVVFIFHAQIVVAWRDFGYIIRPLWDTPREGLEPWAVITHHSKPHPGGADNTSWCALHGWEVRDSPAVLVDALPFSFELDLLEIRMREYAGLVSSIVVIESIMTYAGTPKPLYLAPQMERFEELSRQTGIRLVYKQVGDDFVPNIPKGSFENEVKQRSAIRDIIEGERDNGHIPDGAIILIADTDELISRETLELMSACKVPDSMHFNLKNYRFSFNLPLPDAGNWVAKTETVKKGEEFGYSRYRAADAPLLENAGWHCTFCFPTLEDMRHKMGTYSHNDRLTNPRLLEEKQLRHRVCTGQDPFGMWPVS